MAFLEIRSLTRRFGDRMAVDALDLSVSEGEIYALLGPNGAGKTTTLRMIAGILPPDSGDVILGGFRLRTNPTDVKSRFFFIPDRPYLYDKLTGREYLDFLINIYGRGDVSRVRNLLEEFEIADRMNQLIESYSHGMRQKLLLTAAFLLEPPLLLIDEPLVGLDPRSAQVLRNKILEFAASGRLALISTHQLNLAESIAGRIGVLDRGRLLAEGPARELVSGQKAGSLEEAFLSMTQKVAGA